MNRILNVAIMPKLNLQFNSPELSVFDEIHYMHLNIESLIDNHSSITDEVNKNCELLGFHDYLLICDWLYSWYKKNDHYILSNRILNSFSHILSMANNKRETVK